VCLSVSLGGRAGRVTIPAGSSYMGGVFGPSDPFASLVVLEIDLTNGLCFVYHMLSQPHMELFCNEKSNVNSWFSLPFSLAWC
jgi:hypothetical protein